MFHHLSGLPWIIGFVIAYGVGCLLIGSICNISSQCSREEEERLRDGFK